jgi:hypothetical protein
MDKKKKEQRISLGFPWDVLEVIRQRAQSQERSITGEVIWFWRFALTQEKYAHCQNLSTE